MRLALTALATAWVVSAAAVAGCDPAAVDHSRLISDLADRLGQSETTTFTAGYELSGGATATLTRAQNPARLALDYPGGKIVVVADQVIACDGAAGRMRCTVDRSPTATTTATLMSTASAAGLPSPVAVADLLAMAALDANATVDGRDTTLVGHHATCVHVTGLTSGGPFDICVTSDGVLASFEGTVDGHRVALTLTRFEDTAGLTAFDPPAGAELATGTPTSPPPAAVAR